MSCYMYFGLKWIFHRTMFVLTWCLVQYIFGLKMGFSSSKVPDFVICFNMVSMNSIMSGLKNGYSSSQYNAWVGLQCANVVFPGHTLYPFSIQISANSYLF